MVSKRHWTIRFVAGRVTLALFRSDVTYQGIDLAHTYGVTIELKESAFIIESLALKITDIRIV